MIRIVKNTTLTPPYPSCPSLSLSLSLSLCVPTPSHELRNRSRKFVLQVRAARHRRLRHGPSPICMCKPISSSTERNTRTTDTGSRHVCTREPHTPPVCPPRIPNTTHVKLSSPAISTSRLHMTIETERDAIHADCDCASCAGAARDSVPLKLTAFVRPGVPRDMCYG